MRPPRSEPVALVYSSISIFLSTYLSLSCLFPFSRRTSKCAQSLRAKKQANFESKLLRTFLQCSSILCPSGFFWQCSKCAELGKWRELGERKHIYKMCILLHRSNLSNLANFRQETYGFQRIFRKFWILLQIRNFFDHILMKFSWNFTKFREYS